jgi:predicted 3-demethylubiquinone-9 3-methyltransferase (glyoxalase superfamily)
MTIQKITPFLWYTTEAEDAAAFYAGIFPNSRVVRVTAVQGPPARGWSNSNCSASRSSR